VAGPDGAVQTCPDSSLSEYRGNTYRARRFDSVRGWPSHPSLASVPTQQLPDAIVGCSRGHRQSCRYCVAPQSAVVSDSDSPAARATNRDQVPISVERPFLPHLHRPPAARTVAPHCGGGRICHVQLPLIRRAGRGVCPRAAACPQFNCAHNWRRLIPLMFRPSAE
jgi:hypothetical protein